MTEEQWNAIKTNDRNYDGVFFYALKTTKTICRPSCPARQCNPKNVLIFDTYEEALARGFRPCKRCRPDQMEWTGAKEQLAETAKQLIRAHYKEKFSLSELAGTMYVNGSYLIRAFKEVTGFTLLQYHNYVRCEEAARLLKETTQSISFISCETGFTSSSHFTRIFKKTTGKTPSRYRDDYYLSLATAENAKKEE